LVASRCMATRAFPANRWCLWLGLHVHPSRRATHGAMIDLLSGAPPNGKKVSIALEKLTLPYQVFPINIGRGDQFKPEFLAIQR